MLNPVVGKETREKESTLIKIRQEMAGVHPKTKDKSCDEIIIILGDVLRNPNPRDKKEK